MRLLKMEKKLIDMLNPLTRYFIRKAKEEGLIKDKDGKEQTRV